MSFTFMIVSICWVGRLHVRPKRRPMLTHVAVHLTRIAIPTALCGLLFPPGAGRAVEPGFERACKRFCKPKPTDNATFKTVRRGCAASRMAATSTRRRADSRPVFRPSTQRKSDGNEARKIRDLCNGAEIKRWSNADRRIRPLDASGSRILSDYRERSMRHRVMRGGWPRPRATEGPPRRTPVNAGHSYR